MKKSVFFIVLAILTIFNTGCGTHQMYATSKFNNEGLRVSRVALNKEGLSNEQIKVIAATKPPVSFPLNLSVIFVVNSPVSNEIINELSFEVVSALKRIDKVGRITVIPDYLVPANLSFNAIQELGIRSLSEYVLVVNLDSRNLFRWTAIFQTKYEVQSDIDYLLVDSFTTAILASDKLVSKQLYLSNPFETGKEKEARNQLFVEQGKLLESNLYSLLNSSSKQKTTVEN